MRNPALIISMILVFFFIFGCDEVNDKVQDAIDAKNPALCKELDRENEVVECYERVANGMNDPNVCFQSAKTNDCIGSYASQRRSLKYCDLIKDETAKYGCVVHVTGDQTGRALDEIITDWRASGTVKLCREGCEATKNSCTSGCFDIFKGKKEECYEKYPGNYDDSYWCEDAAKKEFDGCKLGCWDDEDECKEGCDPQE